MSAFTAALAAFILLHVGLAATGLRAAVVGRIGEQPYRGLFSLASLAIFVWLIWAFGAMRADPWNTLNAPYWTPPAWTRHAAQGLMLISFLFAVVGLTTPGPTLVGGSGLLNTDEPAKGILRVTRHPFLWGVAIWALAHLLTNGERFAPMLFGGLGLMALFGARSIDRKAAARNPEGWARFATATSNIPFVAIAQGRNRFVLGEMWWRILLALVLYLAFAMLHRVIIGVAAIP